MAWIENLLASAYPWTKALHIIAVITWMAGLFYLPRLFVYHAERGETGSELWETLKVMERKLLKFIINPSGIAVWIFGLCLVFTPGIVDWSAGWPWIKAVAVIWMTVFHHQLVRWQKTFERDLNNRPGRYYRLQNEVPTLLMLAIVIMVVVRPI